MGTGMRVSGLCNLNQNDLIIDADENGTPQMEILVNEKGKKQRRIPTNIELWILDN